MLRDSANERRLTATADHSLGLGNDHWSEPGSRRGLLGIFETAGRRNSPREFAQQEAQFGRTGASGSEREQGLRW